MATTETLNLQLTGVSEEDLKLSFLEWRQMINGNGCNSNMEILDAAIKVIQNTLALTIKMINGVMPDQDGAITLTAEDIGARPNTWTPTAADTGAAEADHTHDELAYVDQNVKKGSSPTFDVVTANKVIGAVYA